MHVVCQRYYVGRLDWGRVNAKLKRWTQELDSRDF